MCYYTAVIERLDGSTYLQPFNDIQELLDCLGPDYWIVDIF